ncbi:MAG: histidine phosphatase family protein [Dorea sp.]|nr:histidine phosphatase family protein [Dorea sp.]
MNIYVIRHGETDWNITRKLQGQVDRPLNEFGRDIARQTREGLPEDFHIDVCISSPLSRAKETAEILLEGQDVPIYTDDRLKEISFGMYEGMIFSRGESEIPDQFYDDFARPEIYPAPAGGEDFYQITARVRSFMEELYTKEEYQDKNVLLAAHGVTVCAIVTVVTGRDMSDFWGNGVHKNCGMTLVEVKDQKARLVFENKTFCKTKLKDWYPPVK